MSWNTLDPQIRADYAKLLTGRQLEILRHRMNGHSWRTIALSLQLDEATVRGHHRRALDRIRRHRKEAA